MLSLDVTGAMIEFDYGVGSSNTVPVVAGTTQTNVGMISPVTISSAGDYTCTVTVTASGVCGESGLDCPTGTSSPVSVAVLSEFVYVYEHMFFVFNVQILYIQGRIFEAFQAVRTTSQKQFL